MIRFIHTADIHYDAPNQVAAFASLTTLAETAEREKPDFIVIAGDLFNRSVPDTEAGGLPKLLDVFKRIRYAAPVYAIYGTPTHDLPGAYAPLEAADLIEIIPRRATIIRGGYLVMGLPEPSKEWFLAGSDGMSADEANEKLKTGIRQILLGLGAVRAEHPELPCVMLYHGMIAGAEMANGQFAEGGLTIGREDLALVGADYYALGHIHLAQQLSGMPAYYAGSAYPVNWGETSQCGFNLVKIEHDDERTRIEVSRVSFPHPPRAKFTLAWPEPVGDEIMGKQVWVCYRATKEQTKEIDTASGLEAYLATGALPGSRVTVEVIPSETVRAAEITEKRALRDKLIIYQEASTDGNVTLPEDSSYLTKADALEREAEASGASPEGLHIRLRKLRLRGAIGIWKGQHIDEITLDLDRYDAGLIALIGVNGSGKTTLIENMHPYAQMLTRDGPLQQHFRLRDSLRELTFTDERSGAEYRALIQIDGANASGSCEYHLFRNGEPLTNGRKQDYETKVLCLFGSLPLFLRSAFVSQRATKNNPDLTEATKGEKKEIFRELAGLDYLQAYAEGAKQKGNAIEADLVAERARVNLIESQLTALPGIRSDVEGKRSAHLVSVGELQGKEACGKALASEVEVLEEKAGNQKSLEQRIANLEDQLHQKQQVIILAEHEIAGCQEAVQARPQAEQTIARWTQLKTEEGAENERISKVNAERASLSTQYADTVKAHGADVRRCENQRTSLRTRLAGLASDQKVLQARVDYILKELALPLTERCPTCQQILPEQTRESLRKERAQKELALSETKTQVGEARKQMETLQAEIAAIVDPPAPTVPVLPPLNQTELQRIRGALTALDIDTARKTFTTAQEAAVRTGELQRQAEQARVEASRLEKEAQSARLDLDPAVAPAHQQAKAKLETAHREYAVAQKALGDLEGQIAGQEKRIAELETQEKDLGERKVQMTAQQADLVDWRYLERACGPDGIQALELDAMGPGIAEVANRLLSAAYGTRFSIEFRTTRMAGKGSKTKQVEDFSIWILDGQDGTEQELSTLSGGESVWIKRAIYDAFGIIRERSTGSRFLSVFADEADGALDPEAKARYVEMMQQAHAESERRHTIIITHSPEAQEMIGQCIVMSELAAKAVTP